MSSTVIKQEGRSLAELLNVVEDTFYVKGYTHVAIEVDADADRYLCFHRSGYQLQHGYHAGSNFITRKLRELFQEFPEELAKLHNGKKLGKVKRFYRDKLLEIVPNLVYLKGERDMIKDVLTASREKAQSLITF